MLYLWLISSSNYNVIVPFTYYTLFLCVISSIKIILKFLILNPNTLLLFSIYSKLQSMHCSTLVSFYVLYVKKWQSKMLENVRTDQYQQFSILTFQKVTQNCQRTMIPFNVDHAASLWHTIILFLETVNYEISQNLPAILVLSLYSYFSNNKRPLLKNPSDWANIVSPS